MIQKRLSRFSVSFSFSVRLFLRVWLGFHVLLTMWSREFGCDGTEKLIFYFIFVFECEYTCEAWGKHPLSSQLPSSSSFETRSLTV